jgi:hypothetical protein
VYEREREREREREIEFVALVNAAVSEWWNLFPASSASGF